MNIHSLHFQSLLLIAGGLCLLLPTTLLVILRDVERESLRWWCAGGLFSGVALILVAMRSEWPDFLAYPAAAWFSLAGLLLMRQALLLEQEGSLYKVRFILILLVYAVLLAVMHTVSLSHVLFVHRASTMIALFTLSFTAWTLSRLEESNALRLMTLAYALLAILASALFVGSMLAYAPVQIANSPIGFAIALLLLVIPFLSALSYMAYLIERTTSSQLHDQAQAHAMQKQEQQTQQWLLLQRQQTIGALSDSLGHAMVQPLSSMRLFTDMAQNQLQANTWNAAWLKQTLQEILASVERVHRTIARMRNLIQPNNDPTSSASLALVLEDVRLLLQQEAAKHGVQLRVEPDDENAQASIDALNLTQAILHIARNAIVALSGQSHAQVLIETQTLEDTLLVTISDTGPGLPHNMLSASYQTGQPRNWSVTDDKGLNLVRHILAYHHGALTLENTSKGARITLKLRRHHDQIGKD